MKSCILSNCLLLAIEALSPVAAECTRTTTAYMTLTSRPISQTSTTSPSITVYTYSTSVLVGTPYTGPRPFKYSTPANPIHCTYSTQAAEPALDLSTDLDLVDRNYNPTPCTTVTITNTVEAICTRTHIIFGGLVMVTKEGTLTTKVPTFCTSQAVLPRGGNGEGNSIFPLSYPYFPNTVAECCVYCSEQYYDLVAAAFIASSGECQCLVDTDGDHPKKSKFCPNGIEPYVLGKNPGGVLPGPCRKGNSS